MTEHVVPKIDLASILTQAQSFRSAETAKFAKCAFLPSGNHTGRFILDPNGSLYSSYNSYGWFNKGIRHPASYEPSQLPDGFEDNLTSLVNHVLKPAGKWKTSARKTNLMYFYLTATDSKEVDKWEPGNLYAIILKSKHVTQITNWISEMGKDAPESIIPSVDPTKSGPAVSLSMVEGNLSVSFKFPVKNTDPIDLDKVAYVDLEDAYIRPEFNKEKYNNLLTAYLKEAEEADPVAFKIWSETGSVPDEYWEAKEAAAEADGADESGESEATQPQETKQEIVQQPATAEVKADPSPVSESVQESAEVETKSETKTEASTADVKVDPLARFKVK